MSDFLESVKKLANDVAESAAPTIEKAKATVKDIGEKAAPAIESACTKVAETAKDLVSKVSAEITPQAKEEVEDTREVDAVAQDDGDETPAAEETPAADKETLAGMASGALHAIEEAAAPIIEKAKDVIKDVSEKAAPTVEKVKAAADSAVDGIKDGARKASDYLQGKKEPFAPKNDLYQELDAEAHETLDAAKVKAQEMEDVFHSLIQKEQNAEDDLNSEETGE